MNLKQARDYIQENKPEIINLSGKTSTGKSTFAAQLSKAFGYEIIELDQVVHDAVIDQYELEDEGQAFIEVYKNRNRTDLIDSFVASVKEKVMTIRTRGKPVILDGAIANPQTLKQVLEEFPNGIIMYLHPNNLDNYRQNLTSRFMSSSINNNAGLPVKFWELIDQTEFSLFCENQVITHGIDHAIEQYAVDSQTSSVERLKVLRSNFDNVLVIDV